MMQFFNTCYCLDILLSHSCVEKFCVVFNRSYVANKLFEKDRCFFNVICIDHGIIVKRDVHLFRFSILRILRNVGVGKALGFGAWLHCLGARDSNARV